MAEKSKILIIGGTGYFGKSLVQASTKLGHPTFVLVRDSTASDPAKAALLDGFKADGVAIVHGDVDNHESLVKAIKQVDVVISTLNTHQSEEQVKIIAAIKEAGNVKRYLPSEFGNDVDRTSAVEPLKSIFAAKSQIRRAVEACGIPYTYVCSNFFSGFYLLTFGQVGGTAPPRDKVVILGDGNVKAVINSEEDIATFAIKTVDDPRTLNKILYIKPAANTVSFNEIVALWEKKIGKTLEKTYMPEEEVLKNIEEGSFEMKRDLPLGHCVFLKGDHTNFEIDPSFGVEATALYPDVKYTTVDEFLDRYV